MSNIFFQDQYTTIINADVLAGLRSIEAESVHCVVTSPPYWGLRDYGVAGQIGLERTPEEFIAKLVDVFREVRRVLRPDGTLWLNMGDSYANDGKWGGSTGGKHAAGLHGESGIGRQKTFTGLKPKDLVGIPWMLAFALRADGWWLRSDIIWSKPNPMPESVTDRPTKAHEYLFLLTKSERYYYDAEAVREPHTDKVFIDGKYPEGWGINKKEWQAPPKDGLAREGYRMKNREYNPLGRNRRTVWSIPSQPYPDAHFATFPEKLVEPCILAGCPEGGTVLDPFGGSGTTGAVAKRLNRRAMLVEINPEYCGMMLRRISPQGVLL